MVGHRGIEPRNTCVSGRPRRPAGSWPADAAGFEPARPRLARVQAGFRHQVGLRIHERRGRELNSQGRSSAVFETGPVTSRVASPCADGGRIERPRVVKTRPPVSSRAPCHSVNHPGAEGGRRERRGITAHRLAGEPGTPVRFTFRSAPRIRTEITQGLDLPALPIGLERLTSDRPDSNRPCDLGKVMC